MENKKYIATVTDEYLGRLDEVVVAIPLVQGVQVLNHFKWSGVFVLEMPPDKVQEILLIPGILSVEEEGMVTHQEEELIKVEKTLSENPREVIHRRMREMGGRK